MRTMVKKAFLAVPGLGWSFWFSDYMFMCRKWARDAARIRSTMARVRSDGDRAWVVIFAEGTRNSPVKQAKNTEFCLREGKPVFKYTLLPRSSGFACVAKALSPAVSSVIVGTLCYPEGEPSLGCVARPAGCASSCSRRAQRSFERARRTRILAY